MPRPRSIPKLCRHKASGRGVVRLSGSDVYLGAWPPEDEEPPPEVRREYERALADWLARGRGPVVAPDQASGLTVGELILAFLPHANQHYRDSDGEPTNEVIEFRCSLRPLRELFEDLPVEQFGPLKLKAVRERMVADGLCRGVVNARIGRVRRVFKWGVENELVPPSVLHGLQAVKGLQAGRTDAPEPAPVQPVPAADLDATLPHLSPTLRAMVLVQRYTGMRPGEVCQMRARDIDRAGPVWLYRPPRHKTAYRGKTRTICLGPNAQAAVAPFLAGRPPEAYLFSPAEANEARWKRQREARRSKVPPSQISRRKRNPKVRPAALYSTNSYAHAVRVACQRAKVPHWFPNQLRHLHATEVRRRFGLEAAQVTLGHAHARITEVYAESDLALAGKVAAEIG